MIVELETRTWFVVEIPLRDPSEPWVEIPYQEDERGARRALERERRSGHEARLVRETIRREVVR